MTITVTLDLPEPFIKELESAARLQQRSVADIVSDWMLRELPLTPRLADELEAELNAFADLSNDVLWLIARTPLSPDEQEELAALNATAQQRLLTTSELARQQALLDAYDQVMIRRSQAAMLLKLRGYDLSNPAVLQAA